MFIGMNISIIINVLRILGINNPYATSPSQT